MPKTGTKEVNVPSGVRSVKIYNDRGADSNYSHDCNGKIILRGPENSKLSLKGTVRYKNRDRFIVYSGDTEDESKIILPYGTAPDIYSNDDVNVSAGGNTMLLYFYSDSSAFAKGLDLTLEVDDPDAGYSVFVTDPEEGGSLICESTTARKGETVYLKAKADAGYILHMIKVEDNEGNKIACGGSCEWYSEDGMAYFIMPDSPVFVTAVFWKDKDTGRTVKIPRNSTLDDRLIAYIPDGVNEFNVLHHGAYGYYENGCDGYLQLTAPSGKRIILSGKVTTNDVNDYLVVYDGDSDATVLGKDKYGNKNGENIGKILSSNNSLLLRFAADEQGNARGTALVAEVVEGNAVCIAEGIMHGAVTASTMTAKEGDIVEIKAVPDNGYKTGTVSYNDGKEDHEVIPDDQGRYCITMPDTSITVMVKFGVPLAHHCNYGTLTYNGKEQTIILQDDGGNKITEGTDYRVLSLYRVDDQGVSHNAVLKEAGEYMMEIQGLGKFVGKSTLPVSIMRKAVDVIFETKDIKYGDSLKDSLIFRGFTGLAEGDDVSLDMDNLVALAGESRTAETVGNDIPLTLQGKLFLKGCDAGNYMITNLPSGLSTCIRKADVSDAYLNIKLYVLAGEEYESKIFSDPSVYDGLKITVVSGNEILDGDPVYNKDRCVLITKIRKTAVSGDRACVALSFSGCEHYNDYTVNVRYEVQPYRLEFFSNCPYEEQASLKSYYDQTFDRGRAFRLDPCDFARSGYTFCGWNTEKDGSGTFYEDQAEVIFDVNRTDVKPLYAMWKPVVNENDDTQSGTDQQSGTGDQSGTDQQSGTGDQGGSDPKPAEPVNIDENDGADPAVSNRPGAYYEETIGELCVAYCHEIPFFGKGKADIRLFGDRGITVSVNGVSYKVDKIRINKKKQLVQIKGLEGADKETVRRLKKATKGAAGLKFSIVPYHVSDTDKVVTKFKGDGSLKWVKVEIQGKNYKAKKDEYEYDKEKKLITFKGKNLAGSITCP